MWLVRTRIDEAGWTAEFEIPFKTIGFSPGLAEWGFNVSRYLAASGNTSRWASPSLDVRLNQWSGPAKSPAGKGYRKVSVSDVKPYSIFGFTRDVQPL